jgi:hypothetical protein
MPLDSSYSLSTDQIASFRQRGSIRLPDVLPNDVLDHYGPEFRRIVQQRQKKLPPMSERTTYQKAFTQVINLWKDSDVAKEFVFGKRLARIAAELLGTRGVRIYHDQALYKEPDGGFTPWHADQYYWPFVTEKCCTAWVPLQDTPQEMGPLGFSEGSHLVETGRDLAISDKSEERIDSALSEAGLPYVEEPFQRGDVSFHYGWTFHRAGGNQTDRPREAMTVIYMDIDMRMKEADNEHQKPEIWCPGVSVGEVIDTPVTPVLYSE